MELELAKQITWSLNEMGFDAILRKDYSGRGMYGRTTSGVEGNFNTGDALAAVINSADWFVDDDGYSKFNVDNLRQDSMGLGSIIY